MSELICTIFNVEHGFAAFVRSPNGYGLMIDCGSRPNFSPIKWIRKHYNTGKGNITYYERRRTAKCVVTHLHADHLDDVGSFKRTEDKPKTLLWDKETLKFVDEKIKEEAKTDEQKRKQKALKAFKKLSADYTEEGTSPNWGFDFLRTRQLPYAAAKRASGDDRDKIINNRSFITTVGYAGKRILLPGDMLAEGWSEVLGDKSFTDMLKDIDFFVASHHGHESGFAKEVIDRTGRPDIFIISARRGDKSVCDSYSSATYAKGYRIEGEKERSRSVSTRKRQRSIEITIWDDGSSRIRLLEAKNNLTASQAGLRAKHTDRKIKAMGIQR